MRNRAFLFAFVGVVAIALIAAPVMGLEPEQTAKRVGDPAVGASISVPDAWMLEREEATFDGTRGFTVWRPEVSPDEHDHGGTPAVRVALAYELRPGGIDARVRQRLSEYRDVQPRRREVRVGEVRVRAVAVGPIPGSTPYTEVYAAVGGRVYQINVYSEGEGEEGLDPEDSKLLSTVRFEAPPRSAASPKELPDGGDPATYYRELTEEAEREQTERERASRSANAERVASAVPTYPERRIAEGCWLAQSPFYVQTQHGWFANRQADDRGTDAPTGFTRVGQPNFWGQYTHGNLGYGRCNRPGYTNDKFAVDYPYNQGDVIFSPFKDGTVTFAGRDSGGFRNYGIFVTIRSSNGKYVSISAHLSGLAPGIKRGARVDENKVIGYAGKTGHSSIPVGEVHLHQAFYRNPSFTPKGMAYGGQGLKVAYHRYLGCPRSANCPNPRPGGVYEFVGRDSRQTSKAHKTEGEFISN